MLLETTVLQAIKHLITEGLEVGNTEAFASRVEQREALSSDVLTHTVPCWEEGVMGIVARLLALVFIPFNAF